ncbi:hypothetical protein IV203_023202 [Nitzschia inconspicua]|uniref:Transmembrane protein n=1 Tax=Nitzschia inconspicua TaxID=303405 RepID=A0A9K3KDP1_9STRA|nr:hypothetical protein IV203_023202 [Nitzschia inconspicua]
MSSFASVCQKRADDISSNSQQQEKISYQYEPTPLVKFLSRRLPSLSQSRRRRHNNVGNATIGTSHLVHDWMQGNDRNSYAVSAVSSWIIVSIGISMWLLLLWFVPKFTSYNRNKSKRNKADHQKPANSSPSKQQPSSSRLDNNMIASSPKDGSTRFHLTEEHNEEVERPVSATPLQKPQQCFDVGNDDIPQQSVPTMTIAAPTSQLERHQHLQDVSELTGLSLNDSSFLPPPPIDQGAKSIADPSETASQYLSYCTRSSRKTNIVPHLMAASSGDDSLSVNLLEDSASDDISPRKLNRNNVASENSTNDENGVLLQQDVMSRKSEATSKDGHANKSLQNLSQHTRTFEDVLRNVYLEESTDVPFVDESNPTDEESDSPISVIKNIYNHLPLPSGLLPSSEPDLSTIAPTLDTSFPPHLIEDGFLFFEDDEDDGNNGITQNNATQQTQIHAPTKQLLPPPTSSLTIKVDTAAVVASEASKQESSPDGSVLKHSLYSSQAASRKRQLEQFVQSIKTTNRNEHGEKVTPQLEPWLAHLVMAAGEGVGDHPGQTKTPDTSPTSTNGADPDVLFQDEENHLNEVNGTQRTRIGNVPTQEDASEERPPSSLESRRRVSFGSSPSRRSDCSIHRVSGATGCCHDSRTPPIVVIGACTCLIVATILFGMNGVWTVKLVEQDVGRSWDLMVQKATEQLPEAVRQLEAAQKSVLKQTWNVWQSLDSNCPKLRPKMCSSSSELLFRQSSSAVIADFRQHNSTLACDWNGLPLDIEWQNWTATAHPSSVSTMTPPQDSLVDALDDSLEFWSTTDATIDRYKMLWDWTLFVALAANCCLAFLGFGVMWSIAMSDETPRQRRLSAPFCCCTPALFSVTFWVLFLLAWIFGLWFSIQMALTVDTCSTEVSNAVPIELMNRFESHHPKAAPLLSFSKNVLQDCRTMDKDSVLSDSIQRWDPLMESTRQISTALQSLPPNIYFDICGVAVWPLLDATLKLQKELCNLQQAWETTLNDSLSCQQWLPLYADLKNDTVCSQGSETLLWLTFTQLLILVMAMLVWTFRRGTVL